MDHYEKYFEEEEEVKIENEEVVVSVVAPQPVNMPPGVVVGPVAGSPESPLPSPSPPSPSLQEPSPPQSSPLGDAPLFMGSFKIDDIVDLDQWAMDARATKEDPNVRSEEPEMSPNLKTFMRYTLGTQWELKLIRESGERVICQLRAYLEGYNSLTSFNCRSGSGCFVPGRQLKGESSWSCSPRLVVFLSCEAFGPSSGSSAVLGRRPFSMSCARRCGKNLGVARNKKGRYQNV